MDTGGTVGCCCGSVRLGSNPNDSGDMLGVVRFVDQDLEAHLLALDAKTGKQIWTFGTKGHVDSSPVIVENRAGASGNLGVDVIAKAAPDGYTIGLITASTHGVSPAMGNKLPYDPVDDFKPISMIGGAPYVLVMYPGIAARTARPYRQT